VTSISDVSFEAACANFVSQTLFVRKSLAVMNMDGYRTKMKAAKWEQDILGALPEEGRN
jgi:hypothetical protein